MRCKSLSFLLGCLILFFSSYSFAKTDSIVLKDPRKKITLYIPNSDWDFETKKFQTILKHNRKDEVEILLQYANFPENPQSLEQAYSFRSHFLNSFVKNITFYDKKSVIHIHQKQALSITYKNPANFKIYREVIFQNNKNEYFVMIFEFKPDDFLSIKNDMTFILHSLKFL